MNKNYNYYDILGVDKNSTLDEIRIAYRRKSKKYHPDFNSENIEEANEQMSLINNAYDVLSDSTKRKIYDDFLEAQNECENFNMNFGGSIFYCNNCSATIKNDMSYCPNCGRSVRRTKENNVNIDFYDVLYQIFPNMKLINKINRSLFLKLNVIAVFYVVLVTFLLGIFFMTININSYSLFLKIASIYTYIRCAGHAYPGRLLDMGFYGNSKNGTFFIVLILYIILTTFSSFFYFLGVLFQMVFL